MKHPNPDEWFNKVAQPKEEVDETEELTCPRCGSDMEYSSWDLTFLCVQGCGGYILDY